VAQEWGQFRDEAHLAPADIYPVFRELFSRRSARPPMLRGKRKPELLFEGADWDFDTLRRTSDAMEEIARNELGLDFYRNQIEIISSEQMLDAYSSTACR
jgi:hypothetical protein